MTSSNTVKTEQGYVQATQAGIYSQGLGITLHFQCNMTVNAVTVTDIMNYVKQNESHYDSSYWGSTKIQNYSASIGGWYAFLGGSASASYTDEQIAGGSKVDASDSVKEQIQNTLNTVTSNVNVNGTIDFVSQDANPVTSFLFVQFSQTTIDSKTYLVTDSTPSAAAADGNGNTTGKQVPGSNKLNVIKANLGHVAVITHPSVKRFV